MLALGLAHICGSSVRACALSAEHPWRSTLQNGPLNYMWLFMSGFLSHVSLCSWVLQPLRPRDGQYLLPEKGLRLRCLPLPHLEPLVSLDLRHRSCPLDMVTNVGTVCLLL